jgi:tetratricopeptide (TPR) repeat protein
MPEPEWYRRSTWTDEDRKNFDARLKRSRGSANKAQYLRIQAVHLADAGLHEAAIELLDRMIAEYPEPIQLSQAHAQKAGSLAQLGRIHAALEEYRAALLVERQLSNRIRSQAWFDFGWLVIEHEFRNQYDEVQRVFQEFLNESALMFPVAEYRYYAVLAFLGKGKGDKESARHYADVALNAATKDHSGLARHPKVGLVGSDNDAVRDKLRLLAGE